MLQFVAVNLDNNKDKAESSALRELYRTLTIRKLQIVSFQGDDEKKRDLLGYYSGIY